MLALVWRIIYRDGCVCCSCLFGLLKFTRRQAISDTNRLTTSPFIFSRDTCAMSIRKLLLCCALSLARIQTCRLGQGESLRIFVSVWLWFSPQISKIMHPVEHFKIWSDSQQRIWSFCFARSSLSEPKSSAHSKLSSNKFEILNFRIGTPWYALGIDSTPKQWRLVFGVLHPYPSIRPQRYGI